MEPNAVSDRLEQYFRNLGSDFADAASLRLPPESLEAAVDTVGGERHILSSPVSDEDIQALISVANPAHFGAGEDTVYDPSVRDTWVIDPGHVHLGGPMWDERLAEAVTELGTTLGIGDPAQIKTELHSMLVYGEGQFFLPHQDSEKNDSMVATLVVSLPAAHTGGELIVDDGGVERVFSGDPIDVVLTAFYADRRHEVRPVISGHRVSMTFNLLVETESERPQSSDDELVALLEEYFSTPVEPMYGFGQAEVPHRLVLLLDHEYSQRGLDVAGLKGRDASWATQLLAAAEASDHEAVLGLAEIQETRDVPYGDTLDFEADGYLIDGSIGLGWWLDPRTGIGESIELTVAEGETLAVTPTRMLDDYSAEFEGYMGNYGNTVDRWYRRASIVVWPRSSSFVVRAEAGSQWALRALQQRIDDGDIVSAADDARTMKPFWSGAGPETFGLALGVAVGVDDPRAAAILLKPYGIAEVTAQFAPSIATLTTHYGKAWTRDLLELWTPHSPRLLPTADSTWREWIGTSLIPLVTALRSEGQAAAGIAEVFVAHAASFIREQIDAAQKQQPPARAWTALENTGRYAAKVLTAADAAHSATIGEDLAVIEGPVAPLYVSILRSAKNPGSANFAAIVEVCLNRLAIEVARPERAADDWSISFTGCGCEDCGHLGSFLAAAEQRSETWPLAKPRRQHIHAMIDAQGLPVTHTTERTGSPHKLKLHKTAQLMKEDAAERKFYETQLAWLQSLKTE